MKLLSCIAVLVPLCFSFKIGKGVAHEKLQNLELAFQKEIKELHQELQQIQVQQQNVPVSGCDWCLAVEPLIDQRIKNHQNKEHHNGKHGDHKHHEHSEEEIARHKSRIEKVRSHICESFRQNPACHSFLSEYGRIIAKKLVHGEQNVCQGLKDIRDINGQQNLCSANSQDSWQGAPSDKNSAEFELFMSLMKEMANVVPVNTDVHQSVQVVQDNNGQYWQKTETLLSDPKSGNWIDVVKIEPVSEDSDNNNNNQNQDGSAELVASPDNQQESHDESFAEKVHHVFKKHLYLFIGLQILCLFTCLLRIYAKSIKKVTAAPVEDEKPPSYPGNVVLNISMMPPAREKNILRPI